MMLAEGRLVRAGGRNLQPSEVFDSYWTFAVERQSVYQKRVSGEPAPWTDDKILARHRFTNAFRASDRVSQYLIRDVIYDGQHDERSTIFRTLLFKFFNRVETWQHLAAQVGSPTVQNYSFAEYDKVLSELFKAPSPMYSAAYVVPPPPFGELRKYQNHLRLLEHIFEGETINLLLASQSMKSAFEVLRSVPSLGDFLAYQLVTDINYSEIFGFSELEFVVPGPGAIDGVRKCFGADAIGAEADVIRWVVENQEECCIERGLAPPSLWGRPLQLVDAQNLFCEVDKYARAAHPDVQTPRKRTRIKQRYAPTGREVVTPFFPPSWGINEHSAMCVVPNQTAKALPLQEQLVLI